MNFNHSIFPEFTISMPSTISTEEKLQERIKELSCLYDISSLLAKHEQDLDKTIGEIAEIMQKAWRFSNQAIVEIELDNHSFQTAPVPKNTVFQTCEILVYKNLCGSLKVHYPTPQFSEKYFLKEEQQLLNKVAYELSTFYEREQNKEKEEILQRTAQRNDRLVILGEITAGIAHELNTPLGNILGFAELIEAQTSNPQIKADIGKIIKSAIYSREVVKKLMFFACEMPQNMDFIEIKPVILQALSLLGPNFKKAGVSHSFHINDEKIQARLDSIQLSQVLFNILINAIYVSPENGKIEIKVYSTNSHLFIEVADEGPGIKEEIRARIFEPFFTTKPLGEGSGLGLSVVHGIIKSHRGNIVTFDNTPKGTVFQIKLPLKT
ncbi:MAG: sensor histidine kinase [Bacteroidota bacterium]